MVQVIGQGRIKAPSTSERLGRAFSTGAGLISDHLLQQQQQQDQQKVIQEQMMLENEAARRLGLDLEGFQSPDIRKQLLVSQLQGKRGEESATRDFQNQLALQKDKYERINQLQGLKGDSKSPLGGLTGQPIPQEISQAMNQILQTFPKSNADELKMMMDEIGIPPAYSNPYIENRRRQDERMQASVDKRIESGQKRAEKVLDKADAIGQELPLLESSVMAMEDAVINGDQSFWSLDNLAELTGLELFRTAKGGQFKTAAKTYFLNDLKASGARPNQFIEKQLVDALAKVGRSQEANQTVLESFKFSNDLKKKWHETARDLEKYYEDTIGYLPGSYSRLIEDQMKPYVEDRQKEYERRLKELAVQEKKNSNRKVSNSTSKSMIVQVEGPDGKIYETESENIEMLPQGYKVL